jgi:hypothetical protein
MQLSRHITLSFGSILLAPLLLPCIAIGQATTLSGIQVINGADPLTSLDYSTYLGGSGDEYSYGISITGSDSFAITGYTTSLDLPLLDPFQSSHGGGDYDVFIAWFSCDSLVRCTYFGGSGDDFARGIASDASGAIYVTGWTDSDDFPVLSAIQPDHAELEDCFILKFSRSGELIYSTYVGGSGEDTARSIAVDSSGAAYATGYTNSDDFPLRNPLQDERGGSYDAFAIKLSPDGSQMEYGTYFGGSFLDVGRGIAVDNWGNAVILGETTSTDLPLINPLQSAIGGGRDMFMAKLSMSGSQLHYSTYLGGSGEEYGLSIVCDDSGCSYFAGLTGSSDYPVFNAVQETLGGLEDAAVGKITATGDQLIFSTYLGGSQDDRAIGICLDDSARTFVTGATLSPDFPIYNPWQAYHHGGFDTFVTELGPDGESIIYSTFIGGADHDYCIGIALQNDGRATVTGRTLSLNYPTLYPVQAFNAGGWDAFVSSFTPQLLSTHGPADFQSFPPELRLTPNPFSNSLTVNFPVGIQGASAITIFDLSGRRITSLNTVAGPDGERQGCWIPKGVPEGTYLIRLTCPDGTEVTGEAIYLR